jgi:hypothetical protein
VEDLHGTKVAFVKLEKNSEWIRKAVLGALGKKGALRRSKVVEELAGHLANKGGDAESPLTVEDASPQWRTGVEETVEDPMLALSEMRDDAVQTPAKKKRRLSKRSMYRIVNAVMPQYERHSHPQNTETRTVRLIALSTNQTWLQVDDLDWFLTWIKDELKSGGVEMPAEDPLTDLKPNCECKKISVRWDFDGAWEAIILEGPLKGKKVKSYVANFSDDKWASINGDARYGTTFQKATEAQVKDATKHFLDWKMEQKLRVAG